MGSDLFPISTIATKITKGTTPTSIGSSFVEEGINFVKSESITGARTLDWTKFSHIGLITHNRLLRSQLKENDILFSMAGVYLGKTAIVKKEDVPANTNQAVCIIRIDSTKADYTYVYYRLSQRETTESVNAACAQSAQPNINLAQIGSILIKLPNIEEQHSIAATLSSLDDKIELNNRIIANLEAQAQAIFDEWFMAGDADFAVGVLSDIAVVNPPRTLSKGQLATYIEMSNLSTSNSFPNNWVENTPFNGGMKFQNGDTVIARITPCLENGKTAYISCLDVGAVGFGSTEYVVLSAKEGFCNEMLYFLARNEDFRNYAIQNMNGSSGRQRVSGETIGKYQMALPTKEASKRFEAVAKPIVDTIHNCALQNRKLALTRDTLLPKLMSGEIEVPVEG